VAQVFDVLSVAGCSSYERFAAMIDRRWDGIAAYCRPANKVSLGFVEG
jgi:transposase